MKPIAVASFLLGVALAAGVFAADQVKVETGLLQAAPDSSASVRVFRGIPYAEPPVGELRWKAPQPAKSRPGVRRADTFGPRCAQRADTLLVPARAQAPPSADRIAELSAQWVDPVTDAPPGTTYHLFETTSRGKGSQGSYLIYLPPSYEKEVARRYPVIYWLHGGFGNAREGAWAVEHLDRGTRAGLVPEAIVVLPHALPVGWYVNSKDGKRPVEDVIIKDLIPHVDASYRTLARRESRGIEGMSMGGFGALHLGMKYPTLFGAISSVAPAILPDLSDEPRERTFDTFFDDEAYYDANGPWSLARENAAALRHGCAIRLLAGDQDARLRSAVVGFHQLLAQLGITHQFSEVKGAGHVYKDIVAGLGDEGFAFWRQAFAASRQAAAPAGRPAC